MPQDVAFTTRSEQQKSVRRKSFSAPLKIHNESGINEKLIIPLERLMLSGSVNEIKIIFMINTRKELRWGEPEA
jgi:hypothetical protein